jgi:hypothetical protein
VRKGQSKDIELEKKEDEKTRRRSRSKARTKPKLVGQPVWTSLDASEASENIPYLLLIPVSVYNQTTRDV